MATTVQRSNCDITVTIKIQFHDNTGLPADQIRRLIAGWVLVATTYLNGPRRKRRWRCCTVVFKIDTLIDGAARAGYHQIDLVHDRTGNHTSHVDELAGNPPRDIHGEWDDADLSTVACHEIGHLIGLADEYVNTPGGSVNTNPKPGSSPQSIMGQTDGAVQFLQEHVDRCMEALGATCPPECCPEHHEHPPAPPPPPPPPKEPPPKEPAKLLKWAETASPLDQARAVKSLAAPASLKALRAGLRAERPLARLIAVQAVAALADSPGAIDPGKELRRSLGDPSPMVRLSAARALAGIESRAAAVLIGFLLCDSGAVGHPPLLAAEAAHRALIGAYGRQSAVDDLSASEARIEAFGDWSRWHEKGS